MRAAWLHLALLLALLFAPALSGMHAVLHAPQLAQATVASAADAHTDHLSGTLFAEHAALDCLALDQLCHSYGAAPAPWQPAQPLPSARPELRPASALPTPVRLGFQARAPPLSFLG